MSNTISSTTGSQSIRFFKWIPALLLKPRQFFTTIPISTQQFWLTPMLILTVTLLVNVIVTGWIKQQNAFISEESLPTDFQYYSPEQQTQYMQAMQVTQGPVFLYVLPAIAVIFGLWISWLLIGGLLHLTTTLFGGRGDTTTALNIVAWSSLPFVVRDIVRITAMLTTRQLISNPGLSGFSPLSESGWSVFISQVLVLVDIYIVWQVCLIIVGVHLTSNLSSGKAISSGLISVISVQFLRALIGLASVQLGGLNVIRPFFF